MITTSIILNIVLISVLTILVYFIMYAHKRNKTKRQNKKRKVLLNKNISHYLNKLEEVKTVMDCLIIHVQMWANGIRNENLGPNKFGMFRTEDILTMKPNEVYLGNIHGLWTKPLPYWYGTNEEPIVMEQYKHLLKSNLIAIQNKLNS